MTADVARPAAPGALAAHRLVLRALGYGLPAVTVLVAAAAAAALVPPGAMLPMLAGAGIAVLTATGTGALQARAIAAPSGRPAEAQQFQVALAAGFVIPLFVVGGGLLLLAQSGAKFEALAAFGLAFAASVLVLQLTAAVVFGRALQRRVRQHQRVAATATAAGARPSESEPTSGRPEMPPTQTPSDESTRTAARRPLPEASGAPRGCPPWAPGTVAACDDPSERGPKGCC